MVVVGECGGGSRWRTGETRGQGMTVVECSGWRRGNGGPPGGTWRKRGVGERTELATETVIWRPSQNGNVLCHSPLGDSLTGVVWRTLARQVVTTRDTIEKIFSSFFNGQKLSLLDRDKVLNVITTSRGERERKAR